MGYREYHIVYKGVLSAPMSAEVVYIFSTHDVELAEQSRKQFGFNWIESDYKGSQEIVDAMHVRFSRDNIEYHD